VEAGIPAALDQLPDGQVDIAYEVNYYQYRMPDLGSGHPTRQGVGGANEFATREEQNDVQDRTNQMVAEIAGDFALILDQVDHTAAFQKCFEATNFHAPVMATDEDREAHAAQAFSKGLEWAACARDNGLPELPDPESPEKPVVELPWGIAPAQVEELVRACPVFDCEGHWRAANEARANDAILRDAVDPIISHAPNDEANMEEINAILWADYGRFFDLNATFLSLDEACPASPGVH
jgi:hypothetical protein